MLAFLVLDGVGERAQPQGVGPPAGRRGPSGRRARTIFSVSSTSWSSAYIFSSCSSSVRAFSTDWREDSVSIRARSPRLGLHLLGIAAPALLGRREIDLLLLERLPYRLLREALALDEAVRGRAGRGTARTGRRRSPRGSPRRRCASRRRRRRRRSPARRLDEHEPPAEGEGVDLDGGWRRRARSGRWPRPRREDRPAWPSRPAVPRPGGDREEEKRGEGGEHSHE